MPVSSPAEASRSLLPAIRPAMKGSPPRKSGGVAMSRLPSRLPSRSLAVNDGEDGRRFPQMKDPPTSSMNHGHNRNTTASSSSKVMSLSLVSDSCSTNNPSSNWKKKKNLKNSPYLKHLSIRNKDLYLMRVGSITDVDSLDDEELVKEICIQNKLMEVLSPIAAPERSNGSGTLSMKKSNSRNIGLAPSFIYGGSSSRQQPSRGKRLGLRSGNNNSNNHPCMLSQQPNRGFNNSVDSFDQPPDYASSDGSHFRDVHTAGSDYGVFEDELVSISSYDEDLISDDGSRYNSYTSSRGISRQSLASVDEN